MANEIKFYPKFAVWELTNRCNAHCIHCGSDSGECRENELTEAEALQLCDELADLGCEHVGIIGGEFFLSPYWEKVTKRFLDRGVGVAHLTNGLLLNEKNIAKLKNLGIKAISVSIDGIGATHDYLRGVPGLYDILLKHIKLAQREGFSIGVNTAVSRKNLEEVPQIFALLTELNISSWQLQGVEELGRANRNPELALSPAEFYQVVKQVAEFRKDTGIRIVLGDNIGHFVSFEPMLRDHPFTGCLAGRWNVGIHANGNIRGCLSIGCDENVEGNIREHSLTQIWKAPDAFQAYRYKPLEKMAGFCAECSFAEICRAGCASLAYSLTGTFYENPLCLHKYEYEQGLYDQA